MQIIETNSKIYDTRNQLLQKALRPDFCTYPITAEYPHVLGKKYFTHSLCLVSSSDCNNCEILAHANYLPTSVVGADGTLQGRVGLIGNLVTAEEKRGQGLMRFFLNEIQARALTDQVDLLLLWSDQAAVYSRLNFQNFASERRFVIKAGAVREGSQEYYLATHEDVDEELADKLLTLRLPCSTLVRNPIRFCHLLTIPDTYLVMEQDGNTINGYAIIGKGQDMVGVVHEWGGSSPDVVLDICRFMLQTMNQDMLLLLAPQYLPTIWSSSLDAGSSSETVHPQAWARELTAGAAKKFEQLHIWGLDSI